MHIQQRSLQQSEIWLCATAGSWVVQSWWQWSWLLHTPAADAEYPPFLKQLSSCNIDDASAVVTKFKGLYQEWTSAVMWCTVWTVTVSQWHADMLQIFLWCIVYEQIHAPLWFFITTISGCEVLDSPHQPVLGVPLTQLLVDFLHSVSQMTLPYKPHCAHVTSVSVHTIELCC